jgi:hypothetical protein
MNVKRFVVSAITVFCIALAICIAVTWVWNVVGHRANIIDWETSVRFAILFAIIIPWMDSRRVKQA